MQNTNKVQQGQSLIDIVCQQTGGINAVLQTAMLHGQSITDDVENGAEISAFGVQDSAIVTTMQRQRPATAGGTELIQYREGVDFWEIGEDFIVQ